MNLQTKHLILVLRSTDEVLAWIDSLDAATRAEVSPDWLARVKASTSPDPWAHGFVMMHRDHGGAVGSCAYKGPPDPEGVVEIAYGVDPEHRGKGYATEAAQALVDHAFGTGQVRIVKAHTRLDGEASMKVLARCGFERMGQVVDPEDGVVWRWEIRTRADDPFRGRQPTSHERMTGRPWDASYHDGPAPWDLGHPQPAIVRLASEGRFTGAVLDAGCGTGENALHVASLGLPVLGVDVAETALAIAREKAGDRGIDVEFAVADAFHLECLGRRFETVLDCGMFHTCDSDERPRYVASLASVTEHDGTLYVLCFSDEGPNTGPHPVSQEVLRAAFNPSIGWNIVSIEADRVQTRFHEDGAPAWLATIKRI